MEKKQSQIKRIFLGNGGGGGQRISVDSYKYLPMEGVLRGVLLVIRNGAIYFKMKCGNNTKFQRKSIKHEQSKYQHLQQM